MDHHLSIVAGAFRAVGLALGIPSLVALLCLAWVWLTLQTAAPASTDTTTNVSNAGLVGLLVSGGRALGKVFGAFAALTSWAIAGLALAALLISIVSVLLFFTGRGLYQHALWARVIGILLNGLLLLVFLLIFLSVRRSQGVPVLIPISACAYSLWVLIKRF